MSKTVKIIIAVVVVAVIAYLIYFAYKKQKPDSKIIDIFSEPKPGNASEQIKVTPVDYGTDSGTGVTRVTSMDGRIETTSYSLNPNHIGERVQKVPFNEYMANQQKLT